MSPQYTISPARYAKSMMAITCPSTDSWKSRPATILESIAPTSIRWSNREKSYIVSKRTAQRFQAAMEARQWLN